MRHLLAFVVLFAMFGSAGAQAPPPDSSASHFAGEWAGTGDMGAYCYVHLSADGQGWLLIDGGSGDWLGARLHWRNDRQSLHIEKTTPLSSIPLRIMPLKDFAIRSGFNQSLTVSWNKKAADFYLQRVEKSAQSLERARSALKAMPTGQ